MKRIMCVTLIFSLALLLVAFDEAIGGRLRGGGGGRGGMAAPRAGGGVAARPGNGGAVNPFGGGGGNFNRTQAPVVGPRGGVGEIQRGSGSYTTKKGSTIDYRGAAAGGQGPRGADAGRYVGGIQVTTPGGKQVSKVGSGGAIQGPGGNVTVGGKSGATVGKGPQGSIGNRYQSGAVIGPQGAIGGKSQVGGISSPYGKAIGGSMGSVATGPYGAVAGRTGYVAGRGGTYYRSSAAVRTQGAYVRAGAAHYPAFRPGWYTAHPAAWFAAGWTANNVWRAAAWGSLYPYCGFPIYPSYYDYGENVVYQDNRIFIDGKDAYSVEEFVGKANALAQEGREAKVAKDDDWMPLGVFAMVQGEEEKSNHIFQLAINKKGVIRGNYYDAVTDSTEVVYGSANMKNQRAAWTVGERKSPVYEAGIANLTNNETTMLVHYSKDRSEQYTLIRIEEPEPEAKNGK